MQLSMNCEVTKHGAMWEDLKYMLKVVETLPFREEFCIISLQFFLVELKHSKSWRNADCLGTHNSWSDRTQCLRRHINTRLRVIPRRTHTLPQEGAVQFSLLPTVDNDCIHRSVVDRAQLLLLWVHWTWNHQRTPATTALVGWSNLPHLKSICRNGIFAAYVMAIAGAFNDFQWTMAAVLAYNRYTALYKPTMHEYVHKTLRLF